MPGVVTPENAVLVQGTPLVEELICKTPTNCTPGVLVTRDTDDDHFKVCQPTDTPLGWLDTSYKYGIGDTYEADQPARILKGDIFVRAILAAGENVTKGDYLTIAADGRVKKASPLAVQAGTTSVTSTAANGQILEGGVPPEIIVAQAEQSVDATAGEAAIVVRSLI